MRRIAAGWLSIAAFIAPGCRDDSAEPAAPAAVAPKRVIDTPQAAASARPIGSEPPRPSVIADPEPLERSRAAENPRGWPQIEFEPREMRFGVLPPDGKGEGRAVLHNVGSQPLRIAAAKPSCSCVDSPDLTGKTIPPGGSIEFETGMAMKSGLGEKHQRVVMFFEGFDVPVFYDLWAEVSLPVRVDPPYLHAVGTLSGKVEVVSLDHRPFRILAAHREPPQFVGFDPKADEPRDRYTLKWDLTAQNRAGPGAVPWFWVIETDRDDCPVVDVRIRHESTKPERAAGRPWQPEDQRILIGVVAPNEPIEVQTYLEYAAGANGNPTTARVQSDSQLMNVELIQAWTSEQHLNFKLRITPLQRDPGLFYEQLTLSADGFSTPVRIIGRVSE